MIGAGKVSGKAEEKGSSAAVRIRAPPLTVEAGLGTLAWPAASARFGTDIIKAGVIDQSPDNTASRDLERCPVLSEMQLTP